MITIQRGQLMIQAFTKDINMKSATISMLVIFAFIFLSDWLIHGVFLKSAYQATSDMWRSPEEMQAHMAWMLLGQFIIAKYFVIIFANGYKGTGIGEGLRFGFYIGLFAAGPVLINFAVSPIPASLAWSWIGFGLLQTLGAGAIVAKVYKPKAISA